MTAEAFAPAKVNLTLHVCGRRPDGLHELDSLVVFADIGDRLSAAPAAALSLEVTGPHGADVPHDARNLVWRAAQAMGAPPLALKLDKALPAAAGIGGGSSDAAAAMRLIAALTGARLPGPAEVLALGADVPACLAAHPLRMTGIGERLSKPLRLPDFAMVLVNPRVAMPTGAVFAALESRENAPMPARLPVWEDLGDFAGWLGGMRNDLEAPARQVAPVIDEVLGALAATEGCLLARMSGSGATCFGLYADDAAAARALRDLAGRHPGWWSAATRPASDQRSRVVTA